MRKASLGTLVLTVFLDLLGFGLVVPFLPGVARSLGASDLVAALLGASYSLTQFLCIPLWGRLSDRIGRRPVLLWSIAATAVGMAGLAFAPSLPWLFGVRLFSGAATANIAVAQAYIADVTPPEQRARGMGIIGMGFGLGFIVGPFVGGELSRFNVLAHEGALAALVASGLSVLNFMLALLSLPESLAPAARGATFHRRAPLDLGALHTAIGFPGVALAVLVAFSVIFWFSGLEQTFRLFTEDAFQMSVVATGRIFALVGVVAVTVQGVLIHALSRRFGERRLVVAATVFLAAGFFLLGVSPGLQWLSRPMLFAAAGIIAIGSGLNNPSLSSYISRQAGLGAQGLTLGVLQSVAALARVLGPVAGGLAYEFCGMHSPYFLGAAGMLVAMIIAARLPPVAAGQR